MRRNPHETSNSDRYAALAQHAWASKLHAGPRGNEGLDLAMAKMEGRAGQRIPRRWYSNGSALQLKYRMP